MMNTSLNCKNTDYFKLYRKQLLLSVLLITRLPHFIILPYIHIIHESSSMTHNYPLTESQLQQLSELREQLILFRTVSCRLTHEKINEIAEDSCSDEHAADHRFQRAGLCRSESRRMLLGCAHTGANDRFCQMIDKAFAAGLLNGPDSPSLLLNEIFLTIYKTDHERGDLEKELAIARLNGHQDAILKLEDHLENILTRHSDAVARLTITRQVLMERIDAALDTASRHQPVP